jgi:hypothetical protein
MVDSFNNNPTNIAF